MLACSRRSDSGGAMRKDARRVEQAIWMSVWSRMLMVEKKRDFYRTTEIDTLLMKYR